MDRGFSEFSLSVAVHHPYLPCTLSSLFLKFIFKTPDELLPGLGNRPGSPNQPPEGSFDP